MAIYGSPAMRLEKLTFLPSAYKEKAMPEVSPNRLDKTCEVGESSPPELKGFETGSLLL
jgi:hypothetical protein